MKNPNEVSDTYEAAYYMLNGAKLISVRKQIVPAPLRNKYLFGYRWHLLMSGIDESWREAWREQSAVANIRAIAAARKKIKRFVQNYG